MERESTLLTYILCHTQYSIRVSFMCRYYILSENSDKMYFRQAIMEEDRRVMVEHGGKVVDVRKEGEAARKSGLDGGIEVKSSDRARDLTTGGDADDDDDLDDKELPPKMRNIAPSNIMTLNPAMEEIVIVGTSGQKVTVMRGMETCTELTSLCLRSNLIQKMEGLESLTKLVHLELYDNHIKVMENLETLSQLEILDLSFNKMKNIADMSHMPRLQELYIANNRLSNTNGLAIAPSAPLKKLDLGANRLRAMGPELGRLTGLTELWMGKNKIVQIEGLEPLAPSLVRLDVQSNRLTSITGLELLVNLRELYLSHNGLETTEGFSTLVNLEMLDLGVNRITKIVGLHTLAKLEDLWLNGNQLSSFEQLKPLEDMEQIQTLYLEHNPIASDFEYRKRVSAMVPTITQLDATPVPR